MLILVNLRFNSATDKVTLVASGAAAGVGAIALYLGLGAILDILSGSGGGNDHPAPIDVTDININLTSARNDLNGLSSTSTLYNRTTSI